MWALPALMALALLPTVKNTLSGVCLSFPVAGTVSTTRGARTVQSLTIATEWRINISYNTRDLVIDLGNSVPHPDRFNCPYVNRIGQLTVSVLLNRFARKEHRT